MAPWTPEGLARLLLMNGAALVLLIVGWYQTSGQLTLRGQLTWFNVSLAGLGLAGFANGAWLLRGRQAVGLARAATVPVASGAGDGGAARPWSQSTKLVAGPGMSRYHHPSCPFAAGRDVAPATWEDHEDEGLVPCEVCLPALPSPR